MLEKTEGKRRRRRQRLRWLDGITDSVDCIWANSRRQQRTEEPGVLQSVGHKVRHDLVTEQQNSGGKILWTKNSDFSKSSPFRRSSYFTHTRTPLAPVSPAPLSLTNLLEHFRPSERGWCLAPLGYLLSGKLSLEASSTLQKWKAFHPLSRTYE